MTPRHTFMLVAHVGRVVYHGGCGLAWHLPCSIDLTPLHLLYLFTCLGRIAQLLSWYHNLLLACHRFTKCVLLLLVVSYFIH